MGGVHTNRIETSSSHLCPHVALVSEDDQNFAITPQLPDVVSFHRRAALTDSMMDRPQCARFSVPDVRFVFPDKALSQILIESVLSLRSLV